MAGQLQNGNDAVSIREGGLTVVVGVTARGQSTSMEDLRRNVLSGCTKSLRTIEEPRELRIVSHEDLLAPPLRTASEGDACP